MVKSVTCSAKKTFQKLESNTKISSGEIISVYTNYMKDYMHMISYAADKFVVFCQKVRK